MVKVGDCILFKDDMGEEKQAIIIGIEQRQDTRYDLLVKDTLGNHIILVEGDDVFEVLK